MNLSQSVHAHYQTLSSKLPWKRIKQVGTCIFFTALAILIFKKAQTLDWSKIWSTYTQTSPTTLLIALGLGILCYSAYASYDLIGRYVLKVSIPKHKAFLAAWISYACNLNLGALVGSVALRYRLYSRIGVKAKTVTQILSISVFSNWMGYLLLSGGLFLSGTLSPPESWGINSSGLQWLGAGFILIVLFYLGVCLFSTQREWGVMGKTLVLPPFKVVMWQFVTAVVHWSLMAMVMYQFFSDSLSFGTVYIALLVSCIAGALAHVPGGLGVIEAVFVALLSGEMPEHQIVAGIFAYRSVFYIIPLMIALPLYLVFETALAKTPQEHSNNTVSNSPHSMSDD